MRALALALMLLAGAAQAQTVTLRKWQDMAALVDRQSKAIIALQAETKALRDAYDVATLYWLAQVCSANARIPIWAGTLTGLKPFPTGDHACPAAGTVYQVPRFFGPAVK